MSRFTETHFAHAFETATETWWGDWRCVCGHEGKIQNAADMPWPLKRLEIRRAHAAHVESMLVEAGVVAVELPEADATGCWDAGCAAKVCIDGHDVRLAYAGSEMGFYRSPNKAAELAAALLAAAVRPVTPEEPR